ncbi:hypothetical protein QR680_004958 [Steinernema hermaphroditum]|uniref:SH2 domain-containing protein n=1 Tax=Steinernema hermaphroditum TaxID=289476 RepID=A0AA39LUT6_9BILA|nr:hypothetical protein QR680_004958 [Steinernema hermaphroditum]
MWEARTLVFYEDPFRSPICVEMHSGMVSSPEFSMDYMDSPAQSPSTVSTQSPAGAAAAVDSLFVAKHNASAELYQMFKESVDLLLSGKVIIQEQALLLSKILNLANEMLLVFEDEKQYLLGDVLCGWAVKQQKLSIGSMWTQALNYRDLDTIHHQFEYFGELLEQTMSGITYLIERFPEHGLHELYMKFHHITHYFLYYSVIVSKQPPSVVVKCGEAENHRRSRFWFDTEIRVLGGSAFGLDSTNEGIEVKCFLITDETAKQLLKNAYHPFGNEEFLISPPTANFQKKSGHLKAKFDDMRVAKKDTLRRDSVATKRYCLCYDIHLRGKHGIELIGKKVSLPFAVLVGPKTDVEAKLFLERSFADLVRKPLSEIPASVSYDDMASAIEMKFQAIAETPQKSNEIIPVIQPRMFTNQTKHHLVSRLKPNPASQIPLENFMKHPVAEEYTVKKTGSSEGEWKLVPFYEWYFKVAEIVNKYLYPLWSNGLIYGFCGKDEAEHLLRGCSRSTLLIRFSDIEYGKIKITVRDKAGVIRHHWYDHADLNGRGLAKELLANPKFSDVECIYPNINMEVALGGRQKPVDNRKPRFLQPTPVYFDNQGAATSAF